MRDAPSRLGPPTNRVRGWLRAEGAVILAISLLLYARLDIGWGLLVALILLPDLSMLGYLAGPRPGAISYNVAHTYVLPVILGAVGTAAGGPAAIAGSLIWAAHIGLDRALGYGLKLPEGFRYTHLGVIGRQPPPSPSDPLQ